MQPKELEQWIGTQYGAKTAKKAVKRNAFATEFGTQVRQDPGTDFDAPECAAGDHSHSQVQEPGAPGGEYCRV